MNTKIVFTGSVLALFCAGLAFGYALNDYLHDRPIVPKTDREQILYTALQEARTSTDSPSVKLQIQTALAGREFSAGVLESAIGVRQGGEIAAYAPVVNDRITAMLAAYDSLLSDSAQALMNTGLLTIHDALLTYAQATKTGSAADRTQALERLNQGALQFGQVLNILQPSANEPAFSADMKLWTSALVRGVDGATSSSLQKRAADSLTASRAFESVLAQITAAVIDQQSARF